MGRGWAAWERQDAAGVRKATPVPGERNGKERFSDESRRRAVFFFGCPAPFWLAVFCPLPRRRRERDLGPDGDVGLDRELVGERAAELEHARLHPVQIAAGRRAED